MVSPETILTNEPSIPKTAAMKLKLTIGDKTATAVLHDNPASRDFAAMLPMTLTLEDYANTEKIATLPQSLDTKDAPKGFDPDEGDLTYYAPWGNLALFYKDFGYATGLVSLGKITNGLEYFKKTGTITVKIELN
jgi:hypothetical protein